MEEDEKIRTFAAKLGSMQKRLIFTPLVLLFLFSSSLFAQANEGSSDSLQQLLDSLRTELDSSKARELASDNEFEDIKKALGLREKFDEKTFRFSLASPYHSIMSHLKYLQEEYLALDTAAMTLYHSQPQGKEAQKLAKKLFQYFNAKNYYINPAALPQEKDFRDSTRNNAHVYFPVPGVEEIYLVRIADQWLYSPQTVDAIPALHKAQFPLGSLDWIPDWARPNFLGLKIWQWLGLFLFVLISYILHKILMRVFRFIIQRILNLLSKRGEKASSGNEEIRQQLITTYKKVSRPSSLTVIFILLGTFFPALMLPISVSYYINLFIQIATPIFAVLIFYYLVDVVTFIFAKRASKTDTSLDDQLVPVVRRILRGVVIIFGMIFVLQNLGINVTALLAGLSIGGLALALAAQDTVKNFLGSVMIFLDQPFQVGDWIVTSSVEGTVEEVGIRSTLVRTFQNSLVYVPNGDLADSSINNMGRRVFRRFSTKIGLTYDTPPDLMESFVEGLREIVKNHPGTRKDMYEIHFNEMGDFSLMILFYVFFDVPDWSQELKAKQEVLLAILRLGDDLGVNFAFPTQTLQVETMPGQPSLSPSYGNTMEERQQKIDQFINSWKDKWQAPGKA